MLRLSFRDAARTDLFSRQEEFSSRIPIPILLLLPPLSCSLRVASSVRTLGRHGGEFRGRGGARVLFEDVRPSADASETTATADGGAHGTNEKPLRGIEEGIHSDVLAYTSRCVTRPHPCLATSALDPIVSVCVLVHSIPSVNQHVSV